MHTATLPGLAPWLLARGVSPITAARATYLNRTVDSARLREIERSVTRYSEQAAAALIDSFDFRDTREGAAFWHDVCRGLRG